MAKFAPPTEKDLKDFETEYKAPKFAPPTDLNEVEQLPEEDGLLRSAKDVGIGAMQGLTLGGADEIMGTLQAAGSSGAEAIGAIEPTEESLGDKYRRFQQARQQEFEAAKERSPVLTTVGEVAGGLAMPMGALGAAGKGMSLLGKAGLGAGLGAAAGGLSSTGTIEETPKQIGKDILTGGAIGGIVGPALEKGTQLAGKGLSTLSQKLGVTDAIENYPTLRQLKVTAQEGLAGRPILGQKGAEFRDKNLKEATESLVSPLQKARQAVEQKYTQVLKGKTLKLNDELKNDLDLTRKVLHAKKINIGLDPSDIPSTAGKISTSEQMGIQQRIDKALQSGEISAQDLKDIQKFSRDEMYSLYGGEAADVLESLNNSSKNALQTIDGYKQINDQYGDVEDVLTSFTKKIPVEDLDITGKKVGGEKLYKTAEDVVAKSTLPYDVGKKQETQLRDLGANLSALAEKDPEILAKMGISDVPSFLKNIQEASDVQSVSKTIRSTGQFGQTGFGVLGGMSRAGFQTTALLAGSAANKIGNLGSKLTSMPAESLNALAQKLSSNPSTRHMGEGLVRAVQQAPGASSKNAVLFTILQNPNSRKAVQEMFEGEEEE